MPSIKKLTVETGGLKRLQQLAEPPQSLYSKGLARLDGTNLAVVGSRRPTAYGIRVTNDLLNGLQGREVSIISGLALGIDALAHKAALAHHIPTIAVLPCGIETIYPRSHHGLAEQIVKQGGALISEYAGQDLPHKHTFIIRNRIVAALSDALLITEAALKSGTMHTANYALDLGIPVLAVPGPITSPLSEGTNRLIASGATPVLSAQDILDALGLDRGPKQTKLTFNSPEEAKIYQALHETPLELGDLSRKTGLTIAQLQQALTLMEIEGQASCTSGEWSLHT